MFRNVIYISISISIYLSVICLVYTMLFVHFCIFRADYSTLKKHQLVCSSLGKNISPAHYNPLLSEVLHEGLRARGLSTSSLTCLYQSNCCLSMILICIQLGIEKLSIFLMPATHLSILI